MSTRAMICVDWYGHDHFELFYRHCDGYPTGLGQELIEAMLKHDSIQEVLKEVSAGPEGGFVERVEDAFLKVQSDLEWVYAIHNANDKETVSLQIFKTSNPYTTRQFIWPVWFSYKVFMKRKKALLQMSVVELTASNTLHALHEFEKAEPIPVLEDSKQAPEKQDFQGEAREGRQKPSSSAATKQEELVRYVTCVFEPADIVEVRRLPSGQSTWRQAGRLAEAAESLSDDNQQGQHIYVGANPRRVWGGTRSKDVACARCLFVDFDGIDPDNARNRWCGAGLPTPTLIIASGHGVHAYWRLAKPITDMALWTRWQKKLIALLGSDGAIHDPARIMRLPGFLNHKEPVAACSIVDDDPARIYDLKSLTPLVNIATVEREDRGAQATYNLQRQSNARFHDSRCAIETARRAAAKWPIASKGGRNARAFQNAAYLIKNLGLTEAQAWPIFQQWNCKNRPPLPQWELRQTLRNARIYGRHPTGNKAVA